MKNKILQTQTYSLTFLMLCNKSQPFFFFFFCLNMTFYYLLGKLKFWISYKLDIYLINRSFFMLNLYQSIRRGVARRRIILFKVSLKYFLKNFTAMKNGMEPIRSEGDEV